MRLPGPRRLKLGAKHCQQKHVFKRSSKHLAAEIKDSVLQVVEGAGHMVHHFAPRQVAQAVESITGATAKADCRS